MNAATPAAQNAPATPRPLPKPTITRIDFLGFNEKVHTGRDRFVWRVTKFADGWTAYTPAIDIQIDPPIHTPDGEQPFDIEVALALLAGAGWKIRRWPNGARAWKGEMLPVRDRAAIQRLRAKASTALMNQESCSVDWRADFALDY